MRGRFCAVALALALATATGALAVDLVPLSAHSDLPTALYEEYAVRAGEDLLDIARSHHLGYVEILAANPGIDPWLPGEGRRIVLPTFHLLPWAPRPRVIQQNIVVNVGDMRLYFFERSGRPPLSFPIGVGSSGWEIHAASTRVVGKRHWPTWYVPSSIRAEHPDLPARVLPGPDNPMGEYSLDLELSGIRIHGTNRPWGVGRRASHGCIRLYPEDIAFLFPRVAVGTTVVVVYQPVKISWWYGVLWLEVHPNEAQADAIENRQPMAPIPGTWLDTTVTEAAGKRVGDVDWEAVHRAAAEHRGYPVRISSHPTPNGQDEW